MGFIRGSTVENLLAKREPQVPTLSWEDPLEESMGTRSSILTWRIPWTEEPGGLQSIGLQRVRHDWGDSTHAGWGVIFVKKKKKESKIDHGSCQTMMPNSQSLCQPKEELWAKGAQESVSIRGNDQDWRTREELAWDPKLKQTQRGQHLEAFPMLSNKFFLQRGPERCFSVSAAEAKPESVQEGRGSSLCLSSPGF